MLYLDRCITCDVFVSEYVMYCEKCYDELCLERVDLVKKYVDKGYSFIDACKTVAHIYEIDESDVTILFDNYF